MAQHSRSVERSLAAFYAALDPVRARGVDESIARADDIMGRMDARESTVAREARRRQMAARDSRRGGPSAMSSCST